jgi:hypothetical protein
VKTDSPQLGDLVEQVINAALDIRKPRGISSGDTRARGTGSFVVVLSAHAS